MPTTTFDSTNGPLYQLEQQLPACTVESCATLSDWGIMSFISLAGFVRSSRVAPTDTYVTVQWISSDTTVIQLRHRFGHSVKQPDHFIQWVSERFRPPAITRQHHCMIEWGEITLITLWEWHSKSLQITLFQGKGSCIVTSHNPNENWDLRHSNQP